MHAGPSLAVAIRGHSLAAIASLVVEHRFEAQELLQLQHVGSVATHFHALEKAMATHSSVLAWRIPGMGEPGGLPSMGLHRVGHD